MSEGETEAQRSGSDLVKRIEAADVRASLGHGGAGLARGRVPGEEAGAGNGHSGLPRSGGAALPRRLLPAPPVLAAHRTPAPTSELRPPPWRVPLCQAAYVTDPLIFCDPPPQDLGHSPSATITSRMAPLLTERTRLNKGQGTPPPHSGLAHLQRAERFLLKKTFSEFPLWLSG